MRMRRERGVQTTIDKFLNGAIELEQPAKGYRAGMDAILLAAACQAKPGERVLDLGCGAGAVMLAAAHRLEEVAFVGVEADAQIAALAQANAARNALSSRVSVRTSDVRGRLLDPDEPRFDAMISNPPFFDDPARLRAPSPERRAAWMNSAGLSAWIAYMLRAGRAGSSITLIHRTEALPAILEALNGKAGSVAVRPVLPYADSPASRVLVRAVKVAKGPFRLLAPLICQSDSRTPSPEFDSLMRGRSALEW